MTLVIALWVLAMIAALCWARWATGGFMIATAIAWAWMRRGTLWWSDGIGWLQLGVLEAGPWLLAQQRADDASKVQRLQAEEATQMAQLSQATRSLLALHASAQQSEAQVTELTDVYHLTRATAGTLRLHDLFMASLSVVPRLLGGRGLRLISLAEEAPQVLRAVRAADGRLVPCSERLGVPVESSRALLKAFRSWHRYDQTRPVRHWLLRIAANEAISHGRARSRDRQRSASANDALKTPDRAPLPDESAMARDERARVRRAVAELPELYRVPVVLRYFSELSLEEIAAVTGRPASTLGVQLLRGRALLRSRLEATP